MVWKRRFVTFKGPIKLVLFSVKSADDTNGNILGILVRIKDDRKGLKAIAVDRKQNKIYLKMLSGAVQSTDIQPVGKNWKEVSIELKKLMKKTDRK